MKATWSAGHLVDVSLQFQKTDQYAYDIDSLRTRLRTPPLLQLPSYRTPPSSSQPRTRTGPASAAP